MTVNVLGSVLVGLFMALTGPDGRVLVGSDVRQFIALGLLGGFTTFSSFSLQTLNLAQDGEWLRAGAYVLSSVAFGLFGAWLGHALGVAIHR